MAIFLNEHQIGFDTTTVGFPNLGDCMGLVLAVPGGMLGFHVMPGAAVRAGEFQKFFTARVAGATHLYGVCYRSRRYGSTDQSAQVRGWTQEMTGIANTLSYHGPVSGFDTAKRTGIKADEATYVEFVLGGAGLGIYYKRMSKMTAPADFTASFAATSETREIGMNNAEMNRRGKAGLPFNEIYQVTTAAKKGLTSQAQVNQTKSNKGLLHAVKMSALDTFNV